MHSGAAVLPCRSSSAAQDAHGDGQTDRRDPRERRDRDRGDLFGAGAVIAATGADHAVSPVDLLESAQERVGIAALVGMMAEDRLPPVPSIGDRVTGFTSTVHGQLS